MKFNSQNIGLVFETIIEDRDRLAKKLEELELHSNLIVDSLNKVSKKVRDLEEEVAKL